MRQLHLVGVTADHSGLLVTEQRGATTETYVLPINDELRAALAASRDGYGTGPHLRVERGARAAPGARFVSSTLSPREIQARLRIGRTVEDVAGEAGVGTDWVERFAGPIIAEQQAALARAKDSVYEAPRRGLSMRPLGQSVARNLLLKGVRLSNEEMADGWSAFLHQDSEWIVSFRYVFRQRDVEAQWVVDLAAGSVVALNRTAGALAYVAPQTQPAATRSDEPDDAAPLEQRRVRRPPATTSGDRERRAARASAADERQPRLPGVGSS
ncbi:MAG TPA: septation protein SepH [Acidimicrobiales bacterium]